LPSDCEVVYHPPYTSKWIYLGVRARTRRALARHIPRADVVLVRLPSYHGVDALSLARERSVPSVCFLLGLWDATIGQRSALQRAVYSRAATRMTISAARKANLVLTQGTRSSAYLKQFGVDSLPVIESPIEAQDFVERDP